MQGPMKEENNMTVRERLHRESISLGYESLEDALKKNNKEYEKIRNVIRKRKVSLKKALSGRSNVMTGTHATRQEKELIKQKEAETSQRECIECKNYFPLNNDYFVPHKKSLHGYLRYCNECRKSKTLKQRYQITTTQKENIWLEQNKKCACCNIFANIEDLHVEHDHEKSTDNDIVIRGLCCKWCNWTIGNIEQPKRPMSQLDIILNAKNYIINFCDKNDEALVLASQPQNPIKSMHSVKKNNATSYDYILWRDYCMDQADFQKILRVQKDSCAICKTPYSAEKKFVVDHCHEAKNLLKSSNKNKRPRRTSTDIAKIRKSIRGILCQPCNLMIGHASGKSSNDKSGLNRLHQIICYLDLQNSTPEDYSLT